MAKGNDQVTFMRYRRPPGAHGFAICHFIRERARSFLHGRHCYLLHVVLFVPQSRSALALVCNHSLNSPYLATTLLSRARDKFPLSG